ncbi:MAG: TadE family protein [Janthinobacterium lividum]
MKTPSRAASGKPRRRQAGAAAVELALLMPMLLVFLTMPLFYARVMWHYTVAQKAAQDAARYLASVPHAEMISATQAGAARRTAIEIATRELAELSPGSEIQGPEAYCDSLNCGVLPAGTVPTTVRVVIRFNMFDTILGVEDVGWDGLPISADVTMRYAGN